MSFRRSLTDYDKRVVIEKPSKAPNGQGGFTTTWSTVATVWAKIFTVSAKERRLTDQATMIASHTVSIRFRPDMNPNWRIRYKQRYFSITSIINPDEDNEWMDINVKEVVK